MVQGVGFRPFIYQLAIKHKLKGEVCNTTEGVLIDIEGEDYLINQFMNGINNLAPIASQISSIEAFEKELRSYNDFCIAKSNDNNIRITEISPDIAVCNDCIVDLHSQPHRKNYPFINCTNCGPRFTIIKDLPYDRSRTTMESFSMCNLCEEEYNNILNRRFHAQPIACNKCGPTYTCKVEDNVITSFKTILNVISDQINSGEIVAIKGLGGFHLMCDALNNDSVSTLRKRKHRDSKPFAVLFKDIDAIHEYCLMSPEDENLILSWRRPIVLLKQKKPLALEVNNGLNSVGAMLPYMPFHYVLFKELRTPVVVLTSGNLSENPIIIDDKQAQTDFKLIAKAFISYNREIYNRVDDSVVQTVGKRISIIRRSRGYVPNPIYLKSDAEGILAFGAEQKSTFCIGKGNQAIMSQYIGDLKGRETYNFYKETIERFFNLYRFKPEILVCDLHPNYLSSYYANEISNRFNIPLLKVQHHHAHVASCLAENNLDEKVIGACLDGTGFGSDRQIWGGEFLIADLNGFERISHFEYVPMPGGDKVVEEPWRMAISYLNKYGYYKLDQSILKALNLNDKNYKYLNEIIDKNINCPLTSSAGRLFDAVSALLGLCNVSTFDAEAPMRLESIVIDGVNNYYPYQIGNSISFKSTFHSILNDLQNIPPSIISTKFHNTIAQIILDVSSRIRNTESINKVVLSGGVFQNKYLLGKTIAILEKSNFDVFTNQLVPTNDGGISLGQLAITSKRKILCA